MIKFRFISSRDDIYGVFEVLWNKGLIILGFVLALIYNIFWIFLIIPSLLFDIRFEMEGERLR